MAFRVLIALNSSLISYAIQKQFILLESKFKRLTFLNLKTRQNKTFIARRFTSGQLTVQFIQI